MTSRDEKREEESRIARAREEEARAERTKKIEAQRAARLAHERGIAEEKARAQSDAPKGSLAERIKRSIRNALKEEEPTEEGPVLKRHELIAALTNEKTNDLVKEKLQHRKSQPAAYDAIAADIKAGHYGGLLEEPPGYGKTYLMGATLRALDTLLYSKGTGSIILVPEDFLAHQVKRSLKDNWGFRESEIGVYDSRLLSLAASMQRRYSHQRDPDIFKKEDDDEPEIDQVIKDNNTAFDSGVKDESKIREQTVRDRAAGALFKQVAGKRHIITTYGAFNSLVQKGHITPQNRALILADEIDAERSPATLYALKTKFKDAYKLGFTATDPFIKAGKRYSTSRLMFGRPDLIHRTSFKQAVENEEICPIEGKELPLDVPLQRYNNDAKKMESVDKTSDKEFTNEEKEIFAELPQRDRQALDRLSAHFGPRLKDLQQIWYAATDEHAKRIAEMLNEKFEKGFAEAVNEETNVATLDKHFVNFQKGKTKALVSANFLMRGFDAPNAELCVLLSPTRNPTDLIQKVGRVARNYPNKETGYAVAFRDEGMEGIATYDNVLGKGGYYDRFPEATEEDLLAQAAEEEKYRRAKEKKGKKKAEPKTAGEQGEPTPGKKQGRPKGKPKEDSAAKPEAKPKRDSAAQPAGIPGDSVKKVQVEIAALQNDYLMLFRKYMGESLKVSDYAMTIIVRGTELPGQALDLPQQSEELIAERIRNLPNSFLNNATERKVGNFIQAIFALRTTAQQLTDRLAALSGDEIKPERKTEAEQEAARKQAEIKDAMEKGALLRPEVDRLQEGKRNAEGKLAGILAGGVVGLKAEARGRFDEASDGLRENRDRLADQMAKKWKGDVADLEDGKRNAEGKLAEILAEGVTGLKAMHIDKIDELREFLVPGLPTTPIVPMNEKQRMAVVQWQTPCTRDDTHAQLKTLTDAWNSSQVKVSKALGLSTHMKYFNRVEGKVGFQREEFNTMQAHILLSLGSVAAQNFFILTTRATLKRTNLQNPDYRIISVLPIPYFRECLLAASQRYQSRAEKSGAKESTASTRAENVARPSSPYPLVIAKTGEEMLRQAYLCLNAKGRVILEKNTGIDEKEMQLIQIGRRKLVSGDKHDRLVQTLSELVPEFNIKTYGIVAGRDTPDDRAQAWEWFCRSWPDASGQWPQQGEFITRLYTAFNITRTELSRETGITRGSLERAENDNTLSIEAQRRLAGWLWKRLQAEASLSDENRTKPLHLYNHIAKTDHGKNYREHYPSPDAPPPAGSKEDSLAWLKKDFDSSDSFSDYFSHMSRFLDMPIREMERAAALRYGLLESLEDTDFPMEKSLRQWTEWLKKHFLEHHVIDVTPAEGQHIVHKLYSLFAYHLIKKTIKPDAPQPSDIKGNVWEWFCQPCSAGDTMAGFIDRLAVGTGMPLTTISNSFGSHSGSLYRWRYPHSVPSHAAANDFKDWFRQFLNNNKTLHSLSDENIEKPIQKFDAIRDAMKARRSSSSASAEEEQTSEKKAAPEPRIEGRAARPEGRLEGTSPEREVNTQAASQKWVINLLNRKDDTMLSGITIPELLENLALAKGKTVEDLAIACQSRHTVMAWHGGEKPKNLAPLEFGLVVIDYPESIIPKIIETVRCICDQPSRQTDTPRKKQGHS